MGQLSHHAFSWACFMLGSQSSLGLVHQTLWTSSVFFKKLLAVGVAACMIKKTSNDLALNHSALMYTILLSLVGGERPHDLLPSGPHGKHLIWWAYWKKFKKYLEIHTYTHTQSLLKDYHQKRPSNFQGEEEKKRSKKLISRCNIIIARLPLLTV